MSRFTHHTSKIVTPIELLVLLLWQPARPRRDLDIEIAAARERQQRK